MSELIPINIVIADRSYRVKIHPQDEEVVRKTLKTINDKIIEFKTQFSGKDMQDYIAMVLLWFATQAITQPESTSSENMAADTLKRMEEQLDKML